jgi:hypothetical protein
MPTPPAPTTFVAIDPTSTGFAFVVLETPRHLVDRGQRIAAPGSGELTRKVEALLSKHYPAVIVLEDIAAHGALRRKRARREIRSLEHLALKRGVPVERISRLTVLDTFAPGRGKYEVALRLAEIFPDLGGRLPRKRKIWMPEDPRINVFDALGLAAALGARSDPSFPQDSNPQAA